MKKINFISLVAMIFLIPNSTNAQGIDLEYQEKADEWATYFNSKTSLSKLEGVWVLYRMKITPFKNGFIDPNGIWGDETYSSTSNVKAIYSENGKMTSYAFNSGYKDVLSKYGDKYFVTSKSSDSSNPEYSLVSSSVLKIKQKMFPYKDRISYHSIEYIYLKYN